MAVAGYRYLVAATLLFVLASCETSPFSTGIGVRRNGSNVEILLTACPGASVKTLRVVHSANGILGDAEDQVRWQIQAVGSGTQLTMVVMGQTPADFVQTIAPSPGLASDPDLAALVDWKAALGASIGYTGAGVAFDPTTLGVSDVLTYNGTMSESAFRAKALANCPH